MVDPLNPLYIELSNHGFFEIEIAESEVRCECIILGNNIKLICKLSECFPYELPKMYIDEESYAPIGPLPHMLSDYMICTFDTTTCIPNFLNPTQIIIDSFCQARLTIYEGIKKENTQDFFDEIDAYWKHACQGVAMSVVTPTESVKIVQLYWDKYVYLADSRAELDLLLSNSGIKKRYQKHYYKCIYLPLSIRISLPFPRTNKELYCMIQSDVSVFEGYREFLQKHFTKGVFVMTATPNENGRCLQLWRHTPSKISVRGFRKGHVPAHVSYLYDGRQKPLVKFGVINLTQSRLFYRGGDGLQTNITKCATIGCGSIGSFIVEALAECGVAQFVLNDNDKLASENIARHFCGHSYIGKSKVFAISDKLKKHNPNISTILFEENGLQFIDKQQNLLNDCDCIFIATAYIPLEYKIVELLNCSKITKPIVLVWVEPFLAAGHVLVMQKPQDIFSEFFDDTFVFNQKVIKNPEDFTRKESGCQSTFVQYSALHLKRFIYTFLEHLLHKIFQKNSSGNYWITWCGNLSEIRNRGAIIEDRWVNAENYSMHIERID